MRLLLISCLLFVASMAQTVQPTSIDISMDEECKDFATSELEAESKDGYNCLAEGSSFWGPSDYCHPSSAHLCNDAAHGQVYSECCPSLCGLCSDTGCPILEFFDGGQATCSVADPEMSPSHQLHTWKDGIQHDVYYNTESGEFTSSASVNLGNSGMTVAGWNACIKDLGVDQGCLIEEDCVHVNHLYSNPGYYSCECLPADHQCIGHTCFEDPSCPSKDSESIEVQFRILRDYGCSIEMEHNEDVQNFDVTDTVCAKLTAAHPDCTQYFTNDGDKCGCIKRGHICAPAESKVFSFGRIDTDCTPDTCCSSVTAPIWHEPWEYMSTPQQNMWTILGQNAAVWNESGDNRGLYCFENFTDTQQTAIRSLCFTPDSWNSEMIREFSLDCGGCGSVHVCGPSCRCDNQNDELRASAVTLEECQRIAIYYNVEYFSYRDVTGRCRIPRENSTEDCIINHQTNANQNWNVYETSRCTYSTSTFSPSSSPHITISPSSSPTITIPLFPSSPPVFRDRCSSHKDCANMVGYDGVGYCFDEGMFKYRISNQVFLCSSVPSDCCACRDNDSFDQDPENCPPESDCDMTCSQSNIPTTSPSFVSDFFTMAGNCDTQGDCVSSRNYPNFYGDYEECIVTMNRDATVTPGSVFEVENCCDELIIGGIEVQSSIMVPTKLTTGEKFTWKTDYSVNFEGWQLCFSSAAISRDRYVVCPGFSLEADTFCDCISDCEDGPSCDCQRAQESSCCGQPGIVTSNLGLDAQCDTSNTCDSSKNLTCGQLGEAQVCVCQPGFQRLAGVDRTCTQCCTPVSICNSEECACRALDCQRNSADDTFCQQRVTQEACSDFAGICQWKTCHSIGPSDAGTDPITTEPIPPSTASYRIAFQMTLSEMTSNDFQENQGTIIEGLVIVLDTDAQFIDLMFISEVSHNRRRVLHVRRFLQTQFIVIEVQVVTGDESDDVMSLINASDFGSDLTVALRDLNLTTTVWNVTAPESILLTQSPTVSIRPSSVPSNVEAKTSDDGNGPTTELVVAIMGGVLVSLILCNCIIYKLYYRFSKKKKKSGKEKFPHASRRSIEMPHLGGNGHYIHYSPAFDDTSEIIYQPRISLAHSEYILSRGEEYVSNSSGPGGGHRDEWMKELVEEVAEDNKRKILGHTVSDAMERLSTQKRSNVERFLIEEIDLNIDYLTILGGGQYGRIYSGFYRGAECACKKLLDATHYLQEGDLFFQSSLHPNVCRFFGLYVSPNKDAFIIMELFRDGCILKVMKKGYHFTDDEKVNICSQLACGIYHLHREGIIHVDIALRNCLIDLERFRVALTDFGLSRPEKKKDVLDIFCPRWSSPELIQTKIPSFASDIWAMGITFWEIWHDGRQPFPGFSSERVVAEVSAGLQPDFSKDVPKDLKKACIDPCFADASERWEARAMMDAWLQATRESKRMPLEKKSTFRLKTFKTR